MERKKTFVYREKNKDTVYYIIRVNPTIKAGVFAYYRYVLGKIQYAIEKGYVPIVDMQNYDNMYWNYGNKKNAWELFFEQPCKVGLEDIQESANIILSDWNPYENNLDYNNYGDNKLAARQAAEYIRFNSYVNDRINRAYSLIGGGIKRICGIKLRGSDYITSRPAGHAIPPEVEEAYCEVEHVLNDVWMEKYDSFFLSTEDETILSYFQDRYQNRLAYLPINRYTRNEVWYQAEKTYEERINEGIEYCIDVALLAKCNALITCRCQGAGAATLINAGKYEHIHVIERGVY